MSIDEIYFAALEHDDDVRSSFLDDACGTDAELRRRIDRLLDARSKRGDFLEKADSVVMVAREGVGTEIGPYTLLEEIGEGGMGIVYLAGQYQPLRREVALKIIKPGMDTRQVIAWFEVERQALAMMDHPNIARVLDAGTTENGRPYFVMDLVRGIPITDYCDRNRLDLDDRLGLFINVCQAVEHAHRNMIIHRDIKPSNVLITLQDGLPVPKVIDFGVAKATAGRLTDKTLYTSFGQFVGTPLYMSPEQAGLGGVEIDTRCDVYALGVMLYELLAGATPFEAERFRGVEFDEIRRIIREEDPPSPSARAAGLGESLELIANERRTDPRKLVRSLRCELDWITMKALEKDRRRRYASSHDLAADIRSHQAGRPVEAGPPSPWYRARKFARRQRATLSAAAALLLIAAACALYARRLDTAQRTIDATKKELRLQAREARQHRYVADIHQADQFVAAGQSRRALELLDRWRPAPGEDDARNFAWSYLVKLCHGERQTLRGHSGDVYHAAFSPDGKTLVSCGKDGTARLWNAANGRPLRTISTGGGEANWATFSPDGQTLATTGDDGAIRLWNVQTGESLASIPAHDKDAVFVAFTPDNALISAGRLDRLVKRWEGPTYRQSAVTSGNNSEIEGIAVSPDGKLLVIVGGDGAIRFRKTSDLSEARMDLLRRKGIYGVDISKDGTHLVTGDTQGEVVLWNLPDGTLPPEFEIPSQASDVQAAAFVDGDRMIISSGGFGLLSLWDAKTGKSLGSMLGHTDKIWGVTVSPDGRTIASASADGTVKLWDVETPSPVTPFDEIAPRHDSIACAADGQTLIAAGAIARAGKTSVADLEVSGYDLKTGARRFQHILGAGKTTDRPMVSLDGSLVLFAFADGTVTTWEVATGKRLATTDQVRRICPVTSRLFVLRLVDRSEELIDAATGRMLHKFSTDTEYLASRPLEGLIAIKDREWLILWNLVSNQEIARVRANLEGVTAATFSVDGSVLALADRSSVIRLWNVPSLTTAATFQGYSNIVEQLVFSPDGTVLVSIGVGGPVKLWDLEARAELITLSALPMPCHQLQFTADGRAIVFEAEGKIQRLSTILPEEVSP